MVKNGLPIISGSSLAQSGSGTVTPAAKAALRTANSSSRPRLAATPVGAAVRNTSRCSPEKAPPEKYASTAQFSWIAPPRSGVKPVTSTVSAPLAATRNRTNAGRRPSAAAPGPRGSDRGDPVPAIDCDHRAGHVGARRRRQQQHRSVDILRLRDTAQRNASFELLAGLGTEEIAIEIGLDITGRDRVDENAVPRQLHRQYSGQMDQTGLCRGVARHAADGALTEDRGNIDDPSGPLSLDEVLGELARHQPGALEVGVEDVIPFLFGMLQHRLGDDYAGIVDKDTQRPELLFDGRNRSGDAVGAGDVTVDRQSVSSRLTNLSGQFSKPVSPPRRERHLGPRSGQKLRKMASDPTRSAGNERDLACQIKARQL